MNCSVLINNFNNRAFLRACIDSALNQTLKPAEVIVYDDGSTDGSQDIILSYGNRVKPILATKFSANKNHNQIQAVNEAFKLSRGDGVFLLDGDDTFLPTKLETYARVLSDPAVTLVQAPLIRMDREGVPFGDFRHQWVHGIEIPKQVARTHDLDYFYPTSALGFRRSFLQQVMPIDVRGYPTVGIDISLCIHAILRGKVVTLDEPQTYYRQHGSSISGRFKKPFHRAQFDYNINRFYNNHARAIGQPSRIHLWLNRKFFRRTGRHVIDLVQSRFHRTPAAHA